MENNKFEGLEEVELSEVKAEAEVKTLKEYEKLLIAEQGRQDYEKAVNLVNFGCFEQKQETKVDFSRLEKIEIPKKYKGLYDLYRNLDNMHFLFIVALVVNNKGDSNENRAMKPYGYDVLYIETMDEETYQMVLKAGRNNIPSILSKLIVTSYVIDITLWVLSLIVIIGSFILGADNYGLTGINLFTFALTSSAAIITPAAIMLPLIILMKMKYNDYKESKK